MPPLKACGRRWEFGSDDLFFPGCVLVGARLFWLFLQVTGIAVYHRTLNCEHSHVFAAVAYMSIFITACIIVLEISIVITSARGTIRNSYPRRHMPLLLYIRIIFFVIEIIALIVKTALAAQPKKLADFTECPDISTAVIIARVVVGITWCILIAFLLAVVIYLDPCRLYSVKLNMTNSDDHSSSNISTRRWHLTRSAWEKRFKLLFCFAGSDESYQIAYRQIAKIFAHLYHDSNLVLSDMAAGLVLLQKRHLHFERSVISSASTEPCHSINYNFRDPVERQLFGDAFHYMRFALGVYTWSIHIYMNPTCGLCQVLSHVQTSCCKCCCCCFSRRRSDNKHIIGDNSCFCNRAGFLAMTSLNEMDIVYARFENDIYQTPFVVCLDHDKESIVLTIRGTLSLDDIITDLTATTQPIQLPDWPQFTVHSGMHQTALWIKKCLEDDHVLEDAFDKAPRYKLIITGHSLGSGCAGILSILLKGKYPDLLCYCFAPTGSLLNGEAAAYTQSFITSVTLGQDVVCRLSVRTAHVFIRDLIKVLQATRKPKHRILLEGLLETLGKCCGRDILFTEDSILRESSSFFEESESDNETTHLSSPLLLSDPENPFTYDMLHPEEDPAPFLYPPGRIIHIVDTLEERNCFFARRSLQACWSGASNFNKISVSPDMLRDHFPDVLYDAMKTIWEENKNQLDEILIEE